MGSLGRGADVETSEPDCHDPETGREYALLGRSGGAAIVDVSDPSGPRYLGVVAANPSGARDLKVYLDHLFFTGDSGKDVAFKDFELVAVVRSEPNSNSGFFFHTDRELRGGKYLNKGYEVQLNSSRREKQKTGSLYAIVKVATSPVDETKWFTIRVRVKGKRIQVFVNDKSVVDYTEPANPMRPRNRHRRPSC